MKITVWTAGKIPKPYKALVDMYIERLPKSRHASVRTYKHSEVPLSSENPILLDERGTEYTTAQFANFISKQIKDIDFIIGPAEGFGAWKLPKNITSIALSKLTLQHDQATVVLVEQLYRAHTLLSGHPYHK